MRKEIWDEPPKKNTKTKKTKNTPVKKGGNTEIWDFDLDTELEDALFEEEEEILGETEAELEEAEVEAEIETELEEAEAETETEIEEEAEIEDKEDDLEYLSDSYAAQTAAAHRARSGAQRGNYDSYPKKKKKKKFSSGGEFEMMDKIIAATGILVLLVLTLTAGIYLTNSSAKKAAAAMAAVGERLETVNINGGDKFLEVAGNRPGEIQVEETEPEIDIPGEYEEKDLNISIIAALKLNSVQKDLKIKLTNKSSGKLIPNVPFAVEIKGPENLTKTDSDKDGIIYISSLKPGNYTVTVTAPEDVEGSSLKGLSASVRVKDTIDYQKIDVSDEVKSESEINAAKEDTVVKTTEESALQDTVEWVESTKTLIAGSGQTTYEEVKKTDIPNPAATAGAQNSKAVSIMTADLSNLQNETLMSTAYLPGASFRNRAFSAITLSQTTQPLTEGTTSGSDSASQPESPEGSEPTQPESSEPGSSQPESSQPESSGTPGSSESTQPSDPESSDPPESSGSSEEKPSEPQPEEKVTVSINNPGTLKVGDKKTLSLKTTGNIGKTEWKSSDDSCLSVDAVGVVTALKAGSAKVTATVTSADGKQTATADITITVAKAEEIKVKITPAGTIALKAGETLQLSAQVSGSTNTKVKWVTGKPSVATVSGEGKVSALKEGTVEIYAKAEADSSKYDYVIINVAADPASKNPLKDKNGNQLYYKDSAGKYQAATVGDYSKYDKFYKKVETGQYKYTGWQTLNGKTYYYDKNGNAVTGDQVIGGVKYSFGSDGALAKSAGVLGIDVSKHNGDIDWAAVKNSGINFVIIRCGYRGSATGVLVEDPKFKKNIQGATAAGLKVGVYFFSQAVNEVEAVEEASMTLSLIKGYSLSYPVFLDVESAGGRGDAIDYATRTKVVNAYCQTIRNGGYLAGVYANKTWLNEKFNPGGISGAKIWLAQYATAPTYNGRYEMWQYTSKGRVSGISGNVDMNLSYMG